MRRRHAVYKGEAYYCVRDFRMRIVLHELFRMADWFMEFHLFTEGMR